MKSRFNTPTKSSCFGRPKKEEVVHYHHKLCDDPSGYDNECYDDSDDCAVNTIFA